MSVRTPVVPRIQRTKSPLVPQFEFEWHEDTGKVYVCELPGEWVDGEFHEAGHGVRHHVVLAEHCEHHAMFYGFVQTYLRGYRRGKAGERVGTDSGNEKVNHG